MACMIVKIPLTYWMKRGLKQESKSGKTHARGGLAQDQEKGERVWLKVAFFRSNIFWCENYIRRVCKKPQKKEYVQGGKTEVLGLSGVKEYRVEEKIGGLAGAILIFK